MRSEQSDPQMTADPEVEGKLLNLKIAEIAKLHKPVASLLNVE
ncbi:MAG: hypothetical protein SPK29_05080 [Peptoniphilaceae bacterium]|nr:hypothetical protein [Peptoniphilaceae bacterium]